MNIKTILTTAVLAIALAVPAHATGKKVDNSNNPTAIAGAAAGAAARSSSKANAAAIAAQQQSLDANFKNTNRNVNNVSQGQGQDQSQSVNNSDSVVVEGDDIPSFTGNVTVFLGSLANDKCGRVAVGVPYSAYTCNVLMEADAMQEKLTPIYGTRKAAQIALLHAARLDRTIRDTLLAAGVVKRP
ncbi:MAG: hypothetical protein AAFX78_02570 [Cyanobacteria bacterium J06638_20]